MKGFSFLLFLFLTNIVLAQHPTCTFFNESSTFLFKMSKSNDPETLHIHVETDKDCNANGKVIMFFKSKNGVCSIPSFTYLRNNFGFKNYSDMQREIKTSPRTLGIPLLNDIIRQSSKYEAIYFDTFKSVNGCSSDVYVQNRNSRQYFNHIYQEVEYISVSEVALYKTKL